MRIEKLYKTVYNISQALLLGKNVRIATGPGTAASLSPYRLMRCLLIVMLLISVCCPYHALAADITEGQQQTMPAVPSTGEAPSEAILPPVPQEPSVPSGSTTPLDGDAPGIPPVGGVPPASRPQEPAAPDDKDEDLIESAHQSISRGFLGTAVWLDSFFGDERYEAESNLSQLKIRFEAFRESGTGMDYRRPNFDLRWVLPQLRHRTRLVISGDPTVDYDATAIQPGTPVGQPPPGGTGTVTTALQYVPVDTKRSNFSIRAGIKLNDGKLQLLLGPRYRYLIHLDPWDLRFTQEVIWTTDIGWQSRTRVDYERPLPQGLFFRSSLEGLWTEKVHGYPYALSLLLLHPLDPDRAVQYEWINSFQTRPTDQLVEEMLVFRYRQRFWKEWMFLEINPQVRFPRDRGFEFTPGILFRLEIVFGKYGSIF
jgi:hypothetical protein